MMPRDEFDTEEEYQDYLRRVAEIARREKEAKERAAYYLTLPAIKRLELWHEYNASAPISTSFQNLGEALRDWAKEQQSK